jgi:hypothetical protein
MNKHILAFVLISVLLFSCKPKQEDTTPPANVLTEEQLVTVLVDSYLAEGASGINVKNVTGEKFDSAYSFNPARDNHIDKATFDSSIAFYSKHPEVLKHIYERVLEQLSRKQAAGFIDSN